VLPEVLLPQLLLPPLLLLPVMWLLKMLPRAFPVAVRVLCEL